MLSLFDISGWQQKTASSHKIDWSNMTAGGTITSAHGDSWVWTYLANGKKVYFNYTAFSMPSGQTSATSWRNSNNYAQLPDGLTFSTAYVQSTMGFDGNGECRTTPIYKNNDQIHCGAQNLYSTSAFTVKGNLMAIER